VISATLIHQKGEEMINLKSTWVLKMSGIIVTSLIGITLVNSSANAAVVSPQNQNYTEQKESTEQENQLSAIQSADKYVKVKDNQFVFTAPNNNSLDKKTISNIKKTISQTNQQILNHHGFINPVTKEITYRSNLTKRKSHEARGYWWGVRNIFRSNRAVEDFAYDLDLHARTLTAAAIIAGGTANIFSGAVAGVSAFYINGMASDLRHYNATHSRSKIYMDTNAVLNYSFGIWHD